MIDRASAGLRPRFAAIARSPRKYVETIRSVLIGLGESLDDYANDEDIEGQLREAASAYVPHVRRGKMTIYRAMTVDKGWQPGHVGVGVFWTYSARRAYAYWSDGDRDRAIVLESIVAEADIDIWRTIATEFTALTENEVTLRSTSTVKLIAVRRDGQPVPWAAPLTGKTFVAKPSSVRAGHPA